MWGKKEVIFYKKVKFVITLFRHKCVIIPPAETQFHGSKDLGRPSRLWHHVSSNPNKHSALEG